jgi:4-amino-4-deoxy-L-arabinose transferase-like glycosyltransferase
MYRLGTGDAGVAVGPVPRSILYAVLLAVLAGVCCFHRLSLGTLLGDEAAFACTTDQMRNTGDLLVPHIGGAPHLNATPLYNWLTLAVQSAFGETPLWHRFWSAAFGAGCVLMALVLGARLFGPEVGLLAGLLLVFNRDFIFCHGVRFGGMDAMLAFFISGAILCHIRLREGPDRARLVWAGLGACIGLALLSKPPVFGTCFFGLIVGQHVWGHRRDGWRVCVTGPLIALAVGSAVAAPWYALMWERLGDGALHTLFVYNSVGRAVDPVGRDFLCCVNATSHSSAGFKLVLPALAAACGCWLLGAQRTQWGPVLVISGGFLLALTAAGRAGNYVFYVFPLLAVAVAAALLEAGPRLAARWRPGTRRAVLVAGTVCACVVVTADAIKTFRTLSSPVWVHPTVGLYERLAPDLERGRCRLVLVSFPRGTDDGAHWPGNAEDLYYSVRMPLAERVQGLDELQRLVDEGKPVVVVMSVRGEFRHYPSAERKPVVIVAQNWWPQYTYPVFVFNSLPSGVSADELTYLARGSQE